ncbi:hypothetical protein QE152_g17126 [Popillia japonica]|uniref:Uncharacterized protein n=1 Tax=Popillia japonica TaxID=7064 RepID=A0AAW1L5W4_POPJA
MLAYPADDIFSKQTQFARVITVRCSRGYTTFTAQCTETVTSPGFIIPVRGSVHQTPGTNIKHPTADGTYTALSNWPTVRGSVHQTPGTNIKHPTADGTYTALSNWPMIRAATTPRAPHLP